MLSIMLNHSGIHYMFSQTKGTFVIISYNIIIQISNIYVDFQSEINFNLIKIQLFIILSYEDLTAARSRPCAGDATDCLF